MSEMLKQNLILIGMRGSGKTTVGKLLATKLGMHFCDTDAEIEKSAQKSIPEIFSEEGEKGFREREKAIVTNLSQEKNVVIATGGGAILDDKNVENFRKNGVLIFLNAPISLLAERISGDRNRPSLTGKKIEDELEEIWEARRERYFSGADMTVAAEGFAKDIVETIFTNLMETPINSEIRRQLRQNPRDFCKQYDSL